MFTTEIKGTHHHKSSYPVLFTICKHNIVRALTSLSRLKPQKRKSSNLLVAGLCIIYGFVTAVGMTLPVLVSVPLSSRAGFVTRSVLIVLTLCETVKNLPENMEGVET